LIHQLQASCILGVTEEERKNPQTVLIDLKLSADFSKAAQTDQIQDAIDYDQVCKKVTKFVMQSNFHLLEALGEGIANLVFKEFFIEELKLKIFKPKIIPNAGEVGVEIYRKRPPPAPPLSPRGSLRVKKGEKE